MKSHKILKYSYWLSIICLIHCISFPILIAVLPFLNIAFKINHWIEVIILISVFILGTYSLIHAYLTHHKNKIPLIIFYVGFILSLYVHYFYSNSHLHLKTDWNALLIEILSGLLIAGAQFYNLKITPKSCSH